MRKFSNLLILLIGFGIVLLSGCSFAKDDAPEAKIPVITSITPDVTTLLNLEKEITVAVEVEDEGVLTYQWYVAESKLSKGTAIENANSQSFIPPVTEVGTLYYYCIINNQLGNSSRSVISPLITFTVKENISAQSPIIIEQPTAQALEMGKNFILNVAAYSPDNGVLTYQWYFTKQLNSTGGGILIENATEASYEGSVTKESIGYYWCVVTSEIPDNGDGGNKKAQAESKKVLIEKNIVNAMNPIVLKQPENISLNFGEKFSLNVIAYSLDNGTLSYQWYKDEHVVEGATSSTYKGIVSAETLGDYYCEVTSTITDNEDGGIKSAKVKSESVTIESTTINAQKPVIQQMPVNVSAEYGILFSLTVIAHSPDEGNLSYQWYKDNQKIDGAIYSTYRGTVSSVTLGEYYCEVINTIADNGDGGVKTAKETTSVAIISKNTVNANAPVINQNPDSVSSVFGESFTFSVAAYSVDNGTLTYQWYRNDSPIEGAISQVYTGRVSAETVGNYYCEVTNTITDNGDGGKKVSKAKTEIKTLSYNVINAAKPEILLQPENVVTAFGNDFEFTVIAKASDNGSLSYKWFKIDEDGEPQIVPATGNKITGIMSDGIEGSYYCVITNTISDNGDGGKKSESVTTNSVLLAKSMINALTPVITNQPADAIMYVPAVKVLFTGATVFDDGRLSYQWYSVEDGEDEGVAIEGATEARYKIYAGEEFKKGYYCVVTNTLMDNGDGGVKTAFVRSFTAWVDAVSMEDVVSAPDFTVQPTAMNIAPYNQSINLSCEAESGEGTVFYRWYQSSDGTTATGTPVAGATSADFATPVYTERGIYYYYCVATNVFNDVKSAAVISDVVSVAYTGLPAVYVNTPDKAPITSKVDWLGDSTISIKGAQNESWNFEPIKTNIRGRGNTTWTKPKKPYALKLDKKQEVMGMPNHKRWVLIANYLDNSFMRNEMAFYLSEQFGLDYTVRGEFCDLILNGEYKGLYWLGEAIKVDENRVNINDGSKKIKDDEDKDYLIEMDTYYDEPVKFRSSIRNLPYMIKNDDYMIDEDTGVITTGGQARLDRLQVKITALERLLYPDYVEGMNTNNCSSPDESYTSIIDLESWAKFYLINEIMCNGELSHPKSCYVTYDMKNNIMKAGPVWDFDWAALYTYYSNRIQLKDSIYFNALFKTTLFTNTIKTIWNEKSADIDLRSRINDLQEFLCTSADYDAKLWGVNHNPADITRENFNGHVDFLKTILQNKITTLNGEILSY